mmetsp:Transcript_20438/g.36350  ORF Transcript_20438/g.36350 Transcript_20438/m.36350 type:complete len:126 (+) Transcript_20438:417-794(+)
MGADCTLPCFYLASHTAELALVERARHHNLQSALGCACSQAQDNLIGRQSSKQQLLPLSLPPPPGTSTTTIKKKEKETVNKRTKKARKKYDSKPQGKLDLLPRRPRFSLAHRGDESKAIQPSTAL